MDKKSRERKDRYNKKVNFTIGLANALTEDYNRLAEELNKLKNQYITGYDELDNRIAEALKNKDSVESRLDVFSEGIKDIDDLVEKANNRFKKLDTKLLEYKYNKIQPPTDPYKESIFEYNKQIKSCRESVKLENEKIKTLKLKLAAYKLSLSSLEAKMMLNNRYDSVTSVRIQQYNRQISECERELDNITREKEKHETELTNVWDNVIKGSSQAANECLLPISEKVHQYKSFIDKTRTEFTQLEKTIEGIRKSGKVLSRSYLLKLNDNVSKNFNELKALENLLEIKNNKENYKSSFFELISTKEEKLEKINKKLWKIKSNILETYVPMVKYNEDMQKYRSGTDNEDAKNDIVSRLLNIEQKFSEFKQNIDTRKKDFEQDLEKLDIHVLMPIKSKTDRFIKEVIEAQLIF